MQLDMFAAPPPAPPAITAAPRAAAPARLPIPTRVPAWERLLAQSPVSGIVTVFCSPLWTGQILEVLSCPVHGRRFLGEGGDMGEYPPDSVHGRMIYVTPDTARAWHCRHALEPISPPGTASIRFRFAAAPHPGGALIFPPPFREV